MAVTRSQTGALPKKKETAAPTPAVKPRKKPAGKAKTAVFKAKSAASKVVKKAKKAPKKVKAAAKATVKAAAKAKKTAAETPAAPEVQPPLSRSPMRILPMIYHQTPTLEVEHFISDLGTELATGVEIVDSPIQSDTSKPEAGTLRSPVSPDPQVLSPPLRITGIRPLKKAWRSPTAEMFSPSSDGPFDPDKSSRVLSEEPELKHWGLPSAKPDPTSPSAQLFSPVTDTSIRSPRIPKHSFLAVPPSLPKSPRM